ncbi:MAG: deoxyguanosinetriphosphate triphosphohydrolase [Reichenbachiella sp.]
MSTNKMNWGQLMSTARLGSRPSPERDPLRSEFEADYDRIIFSRPFRNLQDKTQVFPLPDQDFVHTRLTHSLEVSSVGRSLGKNVGAEVLKNCKGLEHLSASDFGAVVGAAALAHDVGNPPFGHSGESAISDFFIHNSKCEAIRSNVTPEQWSDLTNFEGNAQGFRLLTRNQRQGLKLTLASLAAFSKYPCPSALKDRDTSKKSQKKYGFFENESSLFEEVAQQLGLIQNSNGSWVRHPLTFLVEAADDICYTLIDLEDGFGLGLVTYEEARDFLAPILKERYMPEKLEKIPSDKEKVGVLRAVAIQILIDESTQAFMVNEEKILSGNFDKAITGLIPSAAVLNEIGKFSVKRLYQSRLVLEREAAGYEVINGLLEAFILAVFYKVTNDSSYSGRHKSAYGLLPEDVIQKIEDDSRNIYESILYVTDYVSGMTDSSSLKIYRILKGINLGGSNI